MATTVHSDRAAPPAAVAQPSPLEGTAQKMGLPSATALVVGSIIGTGVVHHARGHGRGRHQRAAHAGGHRRRRAPARRHVRPADQAHPQQRGWPLRLRPARVRRLRRLPHRLVLLDHLLGRQRGDRRLVGLLRRGAVRHRQPDGLGQLGHRPHRPVDPRRDQPRRRPTDGRVPEHHRRAEVPPPAVRRHRRLVLRRERQLRRLQQLGRQPLRRHQPRRRRGAVLLHRRRVRFHRRRPRGEPPAQRRPGVAPSDRRQRAPVRRSSPPP